MTVTATTTVHDTVKRTLKGLQYIRTLDQKDLPLQYLCVLLHLSLQEGPVSKSFLEATLGIPHSTMSRILQRLGSGSVENDKISGMGLVVTEEDPKDWRLIQAKLTQRGKEVISIMGHLVAGEKSNA